MGLLILNVQMANMNSKAMTEKLMYPTTLHWMERREA